MTNQVSVDAYEAMEKRAEEKRARKEAEESAKEREKRLADARALLEAEKQQKTRNARRFVILDENGESLDYDLVDAM